MILVATSEASLLMLREEKELVMETQAFKVGNVSTSSTMSLAIMSIYLG